MREITEFVKFPKIARFNRQVVVTEKLDGTNVQVFIGEDGEFLTGSRNRWISPQADNYGFSAWAHDHYDELKTLGPGRHCGEWWGGGIQRKYGLEVPDKRLSLFNIGHWEDSVLPSCVGLVPLLWKGLFEDLDVSEIIADLAEYGSRAVPGYMKPEGIVIYHAASNTLLKKTLEHDEEPKSFRTRT